MIRQVAPKLASHADLTWVGFELRGGLVVYVPRHCANRFNVGNTLVAEVCVIRLAKKSLAYFACLIQLSTGEVIRTPLA